MAQYETAYIKPFDGLRALAVAFVFQHHLLHLGRLGLGVLGVRIFFVLSGFLITRILLRSRSATTSAGSAALAFYGRRALRLSPPFLACIGFGYLFDVSGMRQDWAWHLFYLTNFKVALDGAWGEATHLWSLAVEEQFYLLWLPLIFFLPRAFLFPCLKTLLFVTPIYFLAIASLNRPFFFVLLPGAVSFFCAGALMAYTLAFRVAGGLWGILSGPKSLVCAAIIEIFCLLLPPAHPAIRDVTLSLSDLFLCAVIVLNCLNQESPVAAMLSNGVAVHFGKISYGLYIYHYFITGMVSHFAVQRWGQGFESMATTIVVAVPLSIAAAELSFALLERPLLGLKKFLEPRDTKAELFNELPPVLTGHRH
jgi:peptidoglycan/LPS O-acetylase OafA/YrhL